MKKREKREKKPEKQKKKAPHLSMRLFFTLFITAGLLLIDILASVAISVLEYYKLIVNPIPKVIWLVVISVLLGSTITAFLVKFCFDPMLKLAEAMRKVTAGHYDVKLDDSHAFPEIQQINHDFNLMTKELSSTEILKTEFISNVSHEFKTPINAIEGYATLLQGTDMMSPEEQSAYVSKILFNTGRLSKLVGNILLLSKVDNQGIQTNMTTYRLDEQIRQSIVALEPKWTEKDNEFDVGLERVEYTGNENLLMHVWNNLIENAIKYGPKQGLITIKLVQKEDRIVFTVDDEGSGIPEESISHIFDRFYQADSSRKSEGNGLGLSLVKQILNLVHGTIRAENLPEKGTRFTVELPVK